MMRFSVSLSLLLLIVTPVSAQAAEVRQRLDYEAQSLICPSQFDTVSAPTKPVLLADSQAGQLIEQGGPIALGSSPSGNSGGNASQTGAAGEDPCQANLPDENAGTMVALASRMGRLSTFASRMPLIAARMTSAFGTRVHPLLGGIRMHSGVDLAARLGSPIFATASGRVRTAGWQGGYGLFAAIDHPGGLQTRYGHMSRLNVAAGQRVQKGDLIGLVGSTGRSTGPHLHYEMRFRGQAINPLSMIVPASKPSKTGRSRVTR